MFYYNYQKPNLELLLRGQGVYARLRFPMYTLLMNTVENCYVWMRIVETRIVCISIKARLGEDRESPGACEEEEEESNLINLKR